MREIDRVQEKLGREKERYRGGEMEKDRQTDKIRITREKIEGEREREREREREIPAPLQPRLWQTRAGMFLEALDVQYAPRPCYDPPAVHS